METKTQQEVSSDYSMINEGEIRSFLKTRSETFILLQEIVHQAQKYFGSDVTLTLDFCKSSVGRNESLCVIIETNLNDEDSIIRIEEFEQKWWWTIKKKRKHDILVLFE